MTLTFNLWFQNHICSYIHAVLPARRYASSGVSYGRLFVCVFVTRRYCVETTARMKLVFGVRASLGLSYALFQGNWNISINVCTSLSNFVRHSGRRKFRHVTLTVGERDINIRSCRLLLLFCLR